MSMRTTLLANLTVALGTSGITTSSELPWSAGGEQLYLKNMKKVYLGTDQEAHTEMFNCLNPSHDVPQREITVTGYLAVDAKNTNTTQLDLALAKLVQARDAVSNCFVKEYTITNRLEDDKLVYEFTYRFLTI